MARVSEVEVDVAVCVAVAGVRVAVDVSVTVDVAVGTGVGVTVGVRVDVGVGVGVAVGCACAARAARGVDSKTPSRTATVAPISWAANSSATSSALDTWATEDASHSRCCPAYGCERYSVRLEHDP